MPKQRPQPASQQHPPVHQIRRRESHPLLTPERSAQADDATRRIDAEEGESIKAQARASRRQHEAIVELVRRLKAARVELGLSLADVEVRSGIAAANLSRLENDAAPNPTWDTLARYAEAVGQRIASVAIAAA